MTINFRSQCSLVGVAVQHCDYLLNRMTFFVLDEALGERWRGADPEHDRGV